MLVRQFDFSNGWVCHCVYVTASPCRFSVWLNAKGEIVDAERIDRTGRAFDVEEGSPLWRDLKHKCERAVQIEIIERNSQVMA